MKLQVRREILTALSSIGTLYLDGLFYSFTLEPPKRSQKPCSIPQGSYDLTIRFSKKFQRLMPHVENVPGFEAIEIHWGNYPKDTEGCTLVGFVKGPPPDFIGQSKDAFGTLFNRLLAWAEANGGPDANGVYHCGTITYLNPYRPESPDVDGSVSGCDG